MIRHFKIGVSVKKFYFFKEDLFKYAVLAIFKIRESSQNIYEKNRFLKKENFLTDSPILKCFTISESLGWRLSVSGICTTLVIIVLAVESQCANWNFHAE